MKNKLPLYLITVLVPLLLISACKPRPEKITGTNKNDTVLSVKNQADSIGSSVTTESSSNTKQVVVNKQVNKNEPAYVLIYNFHVTNRCPTCIAIEEATTKTLNTYFASEIKQGRIKRYILNVDEDANKFISQKYEAFGSGLFVTRTFHGKETTTDLTGDGFRYARGKEDKFIEILKNKITEYLK